ncbi:MAG: DUF4169 family protein [Pseudolabrys sp.]|jgi:hypothetical protein
MAEIVNLRTARKRAKRRSEEQNAQAQRLAHGRPKHWRELDAAQREHEVRALERHKIETEDNP